MKPIQPGILSINGGSSSIKFALYQTEAELERRLYGKIDRMGLNGTYLSFNDISKNQHETINLPGTDYKSAADFLLDWLEKQNVFSTLSAIGHRVVHGMEHAQPERVTGELLKELKRIIPYDPDHLPHEIEMIESLGQRYPKLLQVVCFDTAFHQSMPPVARLLPIPRRYQAKGVKRYGFHGLSYTYLLAELEQLGDSAARQGKVILAHLGSGSSLAAVRDGLCIDTSMGFTPASGLPMSTRSGDLDPGLIGYLAHNEKMTPSQFSQMVNHESGLLGVSELSSDVRDLLDAEANDVRAAEALALYCYQVKKWIGSFAAALGGLDTLVFTGGIGENSPQLRERICQGLEFLGIELHPLRNQQAPGLISTDLSRVKVRVLCTDEELTIARAVRRLI